jgi:hypothetical protein
MSGAGTHDEAISLVSDDETAEDHVAGIGLNADASRRSLDADNRLWGPGLAGGQVQVSKIIRDISLRIQPGMTLYGYSILLLASELIDKDCPKARSGGASLAAALVLKVPPEQMVVWMQRAEQLFAKEVHIVWLTATRPETFIEWLRAARRDRLEHVPANVADDAVLAAQMCAKEHFLLGYEQGASAARPNAAAMELLRWLLLDKPRPQLAFAILRLKPILIQHGGDFGGSDFDAEMPRTWASQWASRADLVTSTRFFWVGQGGVMTPSDDALVRERSAADSYTRAARQRLGCVHATTSTRAECYGPLGNFKSMCSACRREPEAVLRDHCRGLIETGTATASCTAGQNLCSVCRGGDGRKLKDGEERISNQSRTSATEPCPGGCKGRDKVTPRTNHACQKGYRDYLDAGVFLNPYKCDHRAALPPPLKRARRD